MPTDLLSPLPATDAAVGRVGPALGLFFEFEPIDDRIGAAEG
jgi:hypothetical protein